MREMTSQLITCSQCLWLNRAGVVQPRRPSRCGWTEASVWTERMLATLERGIKGLDALSRTWTNLLSLSPRQSGQPTMDRPLTGEPYAGKPPVRFGGRGEVLLLAPTPIVCVAHSARDNPDGQVELTQVCSSIPCRNSQFAPWVRYFLATAFCCLSDAKGFDSF